ncbi:hypothetical protein EV144_103316 [Flavobacterium sp. 270]|uniref:hypothetical protein n=1 Tax=Flavobacterium sp. 270 TaxID=2512114 RepID=UPI0010647A33|nr:hypothetical protein [Flavobacterium sp. 270]TDW48799.1 hypothetical protein EV144_103316 [Flavobacterium sp. 270]
MENDKNRNYDQDDRNYYKEGQSPDNYERSELQDQNPEEDRMDRRAEEFSTEQPNRYSDNENGINSPETDDENRRTDQNQEGNLEPNYDEIRRNPLRRDRDL